MRKLLASGALCALSMATPAVATTINFDDLGNGAIVTNQYAGVTFSSSAGSQVLTTAQSLGSSLPNFICSGQGGTINCTDPIFVDFAGTGVAGLTFLAVGDNQAGVNGSVSVYGSGGALLGTVATLGDNDFFTPYTVDLTAFTGITRIAITNTDPGGLGYDDFTFGPSAGGSVPEPASWAMMLFGFGSLGRALRRRSQASARIRFA